MVLSHYNRPMLTVSLCCGFLIDIFSIDFLSFKHISPQKEKENEKICPALLNGMKLIDRQSTQSILVAQVFDRLQGLIYCILKSHGLICCF